MVQASVLDGLVFDASPFSQDGFAAPEVDISWGEVADALVVAVVVVVVDEGRDGGFKLSFEEVVFQQDAVFEGLMPSLDFALCLLLFNDSGALEGSYNDAVLILHWFYICFAKLSEGLRMSSKIIPCYNLQILDFVLFYYVVY